MTAKRPGAIVLAGGRARRFGGAAKPAALIAGRSLLQRVVDATDQALDSGGGQCPIVVVGDADSLADSARAITMREDPQYAGPLAAIGAGLRALPADVNEVIILAADLPFLSATDVGSLRRALEAPGDAAVAVSGGRRHWLIAAWRRGVLEHSVAGLGALADRPARLLYNDVQVVEVALSERSTYDIDTREDLHAAKEWNE